MDFIKQHGLNQWFSNVSLMHVVVVGLLLSNLLAGGLIWYGTFHQKIEVTPFSGTPGYQNSELSVDRHYLSMMTENFMYSRFNVTPDTVRVSHQRLLPFIDEHEYPKISETLNREARVVAQKKASSYFEIKDLQVDVRQRACTVKGVLNRAYGSHTFRAEPMTCSLQYQYHLGRLSVQSFDCLEVPKEAIVKRAGKGTKKRG